MKNIKLELFNFRKGLSLEQEEVSMIVESYIDLCKELSEKQIINALNERLRTYTFDKISAHRTLGETTLVFREKNRVTGAERFHHIESIWDLRMLEQVTDESELAQFDPEAAEAAKNQFQLARQPD